MTVTVRTVFVFGLSELPMVVHDYTQQSALPIAYMHVHAESLDVYSHISCIDIDIFSQFTHAVLRIHMY